MLWSFPDLNNYNYQISCQKRRTRPVGIIITSEGRRVTKGGRGGGGSPAIFQSLNSALILEKNVLTVFIYALNFSFKLLF